jgi:serine/threonine protein kinase
VEAVDQPDIAISELPKWTKEPGSEPIPGYRLLEPLGKGGFGEVWKCEAPGGLNKAVKFVPYQDGSGSPASQERAALHRIKAIRHPFILSLDRVEVVDGILVIVMELADKSLYTLLADYQAQNLPGIPREELLGYLLEAAEALDWMNFGHNLQHLDIKPHNLFLVSNHLKVADFGLVDRPNDVESSIPGPRQGGVTPLYAAPEQLNGNISRHCDQYSLAIVYQQLLTGTLPFWHQNMYQLMLLHLSVEPNLMPLPPDDRAVLARALSKRPEDRFPSCLDFLQALICGTGGSKPDLPRRASAAKKFAAALPPADKVPSPTATENEGNGPDTAAPEGHSGAAKTLPTSWDIPANTTPTGTLLATSSPTPLGQRPNLERPRKGPASVLAPTCISAPGYRFLHAIGQTPLGDIWKVEDEQGCPRRALCLHNFVDKDTKLLEQLKNLTHPVLPAVEGIWSPAGRLVLITDEHEQTLRDRLEACQKEGLPGIPRDELLGYLRVVAEALDALYQQYNLAHLGLNSRTLLLQKDSVWISDFGLVPLIWLPTGQTGGHLNGRYAAPELFEKPDLSLVPPGDATRAALIGRAGSVSDQYSLALIYAELLQGLSPQFPRVGAATHRRGGRRAARSDSALLPIRGQPRVDLELMPICDRDILRKALHEDPDQRFPSCTALVEALQTAIARTTRLAQLYSRLPRVIPFSSLQGEPPPTNVVLPPVNQLVLTLAMPTLGLASSSRTILGAQNVRYVAHQNHIWECKCPVQIFTGALPLKVEGFREEWHARTAQARDDSFVFHIDIHLPPRPTDRLPIRPEPAHLVEFELEVQSAAASAKHLAEVRMRVRPIGGDHERLGRALTELAPRLFDSMRRYLQAGAELRSSDRWQCPQPLHVYPVRTDLELEDVLDGISRNISLSGVSFRVPQVPSTEVAYLHWHKSPGVSPYAVLVRIVRAQPMVGGGFEVGAAFTESV